MIKKAEKVKKIEKAKKIEGKRGPYERVPILPACYDFVFKRIFGENTSVFLSFLNSIFEKTNERKAVSVTYLKTEFPREHRDGRSHILDVRATLDDGTHCNVEVQVETQDSFEARTLFHWSKLYCDQLSKGGSFDDLKKTICINVLDFILFPEEEDFFNHYAIVNQKSLKRRFEHFGAYCFELPKFRKKAYNETQAHTMLENWTSFLSDNSKENLEKIAMQDQSLKQAYEKLKYLSADEEMQYLYHMERMKEIGNRTNLRAAEKKGKAEGLAEGEVNGEKKGRAAEKRAMAKKLRAKGMSNQEIAEITALSIKEIENI
jgi:predicted transposase/invertase (TIGR01784 family)